MRDEYIFRLRRLSCGRQKYFITNNKFFVLVLKDTKIFYHYTFLFIKMPWFCVSKHWTCDPKSYTLMLITHFHVHGPWSRVPRRYYLQTLISLSHFSLLLSYKYWGRDSRKYSVNHFFYFALKPISFVSHLSPSCMPTLKLLSKKAPYANPLFFLTVTVTPHFLLLKVLPISFT